MTTRRAFMKTIIGMPGLLALDPAWATPDPSRVALVIGNGGYKQGPLTNPANDAAAMRNLFVGAGFTTESRLNATRIDMLAVIDQFAAHISRAETKLAIFYYAGHGVQLDWRNYLLPIDIDVRSPEDIKNQCVDLGILLGKMSKVKDKTFVIILDACRDDPFKGTYRPEQKGLSQFDAPVGSLLAYATSPGNVASDGNGKNGLYTENLIQELSNRQARIEDALKRVRLKVRLASGGQQIPWETTSLESDVFIFPEASKKLSESELVRLIEADTAEWERIKYSKKFDDWKNYLLNFPNGRFAEIAQVRLASLLPETGKVGAGSGGAPETGSALPAIEIAPGKPLPPIFEISKNPNSSGRYPLARRFTVGDEFGLVLYDLFSGAEKESVLLVTAVDTESDRVELNDGAYIWDGMGNIIKSPLMARSTVPRQFFPAELQIGKKWNAAWSSDETGLPSHTSVDFHIIAMETIRVPAGEFLTFVIEFTGWNTQMRTLKGKSWVVPGLNVCIKQEMLQRSGAMRRGTYSIADGYKLTWLRQQTMDRNYTTVQGQGSSRALVVKNSGT